MISWALWLARMAFWALSLAVRPLQRPPAWVSLLIEEPPPELPPPAGPFWQRFLARPVLTVRDLYARVHAVSRDERLRGIVLHLRPMALSDSQAQTLSDLIAEARAGGKQVVCWATTYTAATYRVACAADRILLQPGGSLGVLGFHREYVFFAEAMGRAGLQADLLQISPYKTAGDPLTRRRFTPEAREMAEWLAESAQEELLANIARGRGIDQAAARELVDGSPFTDDQALAAAAVDGLAGEEELTRLLEGRVEPFSAARRKLRRSRPPRPGRFIGLLRIEGTILDGRSRQPPARLPLPVPLLFDQQAGDLTVVQQARALAVNRRVAAVVLWVDSRGGSATASEAMASALRGLAAKKPLVAAMGTVAASGGYYVAAPARRVFAQPGTLTGSIGVLGGKLVAGGLWERLLFNREAVTRGEHAGMNSWARAYSDEERQKVRASIERTYEVFLDRVSGGRGLSRQELQPIAGGRVWTGRQALERRLVDDLGGLELALREARRMAGLAADAPFREAKAPRREPALAPAGAAWNLAGHALATLSSLNRATSWLLCPLWPASGELE